MYFSCHYREHPKADKNLEGATFLFQARASRLSIVEKHGMPFDIKVKRTLEYKNFFFYFIKKIFRSL